MVKRPEDPDYVPDWAEAKAPPVAAPTLVTPTQEINAASVVEIRPYQDGCWLFFAPRQPVIEGSEGLRLFVRRPEGEVREVINQARREAGLGTI